MEERNLPLEFRLKAEEFINMLSKGEVDYHSTEFKSQLQDLVNVYDSKAFKQYRDEFLGLIGGEREPEMIKRANRSIMQNYFEVNAKMALLRNYSRTLNKSREYDLPDTWETELPTIINIVINGLETMARDYDVSEVA